MTSISTAHVLRAREYGSDGCCLFGGVGVGAGREDTVRGQLALDGLSGRLRHERLLSTHVTFPRRLCVQHRLTGHGGCVNTVEWDTGGRMLVSGSDDTTLKLWNERYECVHSLSPGHLRNVFCASFAPNDLENIVSVGAEGSVIHSHVLGAGGRYNATYRSLETDVMVVFNLRFLPFSRHCFLTASEDGGVRTYDLRLDAQSAASRLHGLPHRCSARGLAIDPLRPHHIAVGCHPQYGAENELEVYMFDLRRASSSSSRAAPVAKFMDPRQLDSAHAPSRNQGATGLALNELGELAVTFGDADVCLFDTRSAPCDDVCTDVVQRYVGRANVQTFLKDVAFLGDDQYVVTGSDCGRMFVWEKGTGRLVQWVRGDSNVVNGVFPHPHGHALATCGIDSDVKVWGFGEEPGSASVYALQRQRALADRTDEAAAAAVVEPTGDLMCAEMAAYDWRAHAAASGAARRDWEQRRKVLAVGECHEVLSSARRLKAQGNEEFARKEYSAGVAAYREARQALGSCYAPTVGLERERQQLRQQCLLNSAMCHLQLQNFKEAKELCDAVLVDEPVCVKGLFRRGKALLELGAVEAANEDLALAERLAPDDVRIRALARVARERSRRAERAMKERYQKMFSTE
eukprot:TRINITY_DN5062_c0_g1_i1.p1 TRINITY_DN5062_c0_g1~~TRINITY_DN5062_c0_g1_i1.p1  ORF type:complete len:631 (-),score=198.67 TRINITY_DN5062_c0_g1_i1:279-2171(-)